MTAQNGSTDDRGSHADDTLIVAGVVPCATCGERLPQPGRLYCQACLDAEWRRRHASGPLWDARYREYHRPG